MEPKPLYHENFDLENVISPVKVEVLQQLLRETNYNNKEIEFLVDGFTNGFDIGYRGDMNVKRRSPNLKLRVGSQVVPWNKIMKEVGLGRYAGPFAEDAIPFKYYIQSPVGLVPKDGGRDTRLIFHLSFPRSGSSVNSETPREMTKVTYCDFADAIKLCLKAGKHCKLSKSDMKSAFRNLGIKNSPIKG